MWMRLIPIRLLLPRSCPRIHSALQVRGKREVGVMDQKSDLDL